nr:unnamed protein product [Callosobruchus analis]
MPLDLASSTNYEIREAQRLWLISSSDWSSRLHTCLFHLPNVKTNIYGSRFTRFQQRLEFWIANMSVFQSRTNLGMNI